MDYKEYYSEEFREDMLEVSDRRMLWEIHSDDFNEDEYYLRCDAARNRLSQHYHTDIVFCGRSGRHVCMRNTPTNRRNYRHIVKAVRREQDEILKMYN
jgi:hypothetical protein